MLTPCRPKTVPTRPIIPGTSLVAEQRDVVLELDVEPLAPRLEQVGPVAPPDQRAGDAHAVASPPVIVTRIRSV